MLTPDQPDTDAFLRGVRVARDKGKAGVLATIFSTRTLGLTGQLAREQQPDYLSGLLIGHELSGLEAALAQQQSTLAGSALQLIGNAALCERYRLALAQFGCHQADLVKQATERGLWRIAAQAGLVSEASGAAQATVSQAMGAHMPPLVLAWLLAAGVRVYMGSATVDMAVASGVLAPMAGTTGLHPELLVMATGCGSLMLSHVNDSGFWLVQSLFGISTKETLATWSIVETVLSICGLLFTLLLAALLR